MDFSIKLTKRTRKRKRTDGQVVLHDRYVLNYREPRSGQRRQEFFERKKEAETRERELRAKVADNAYVDERTVPTISEAADHWLADREGKVKASTLKGYKVVTKCITGPLLEASTVQRRDFTATGEKPKGSTFITLLGRVKVSELTTAMIRSWHRIIVEQCGNYTANRAKAHLKSILALAEEDFGIRAPSMPTGLSRVRHKAKKVILSSADIRVLIQAAKFDVEQGIYYAFPFLAGTRPSEQLGLLWEDIDFDKSVIHIRRIQERDGTFTEMTKTEAGTRDIPLGATLRALLLDWRVRCPRKAGKLYRVFPGPGRLQKWPMPRTGGGGPLLYQNFRRRYWAPAFQRFGLPYVTPHSARHSFISTLQAQGIEIGLVAQIAGHANPTVTLGHYTQAVRGGASAIAALDEAYTVTA